MDNIQITKDCIKEAQTWGHYTYYNICNDSIHTVPWAFGEWLVVVLATAVLVGIFFRIRYLIKN